METKPENAVSIIECDMKVCHYSVTCIVLKFCCCRWTLQLLWGIRSRKWSQWILIKRTQWYGLVLLRGVACVVRGVVLCD